ncbi:MAG: ferritin-like domain-containing protein [Verrucomicrobiota bacterium]
MNIYKVMPDLSNERQMRLWYQGIRKQWSAADIEWNKPGRISSEKMRDQLGRLLTPVLTGEQSALYSVSGLIPILGHRSEVPAQFYLTTWAVDEARHTELFARFYERIDREPLSIRKFPAGYLFQSRIISKDPTEWLTGVLASESMAQVVSHELKELDIDPVLSEICAGILEDEARHLGFNHIYIEEQFKKLYETDEEAAEVKAKGLRDHIHHVLEGVPPILNALMVELKDVGIDIDKVQHTLDRVAKQRLDKAINGGKKQAAGKAVPVDDEPEVHAAEM